MKHFTIVLVVVLFAFVGNVSGQYNSLVLLYPNNGWDTHRNFNYLGIPYDGHLNFYITKADRFVTEVYYTNGDYLKEDCSITRTNNTLEIKNKRDKYLSYSLDLNNNNQLESFTIYSYNVNNTSIVSEKVIYSYFYDKEGRVSKLAANTFALDNNSAKIILNYHYDTKNRLDSIVTTYKDSITSKNIITYESDCYINEEDTYKNNEINHIESQTTYTIDGSNRLIKKFYHNLRENYNETYTYEYTSDGFIEYYKDSPHDYTIKNIYHFNEKGDLVKIDAYSNEGHLDTFESGGSIRYTYTYNTITSNDKVVANLDNIITKKGAFVIDSNVANKPYYIYGLDGRLVKNGIVNSGMNEIPINEGVYIISFNGTNKKMLVR